MMEAATNTMDHGQIQVMDTGINLKLSRGPLCCFAVEDGYVWVSLASAAGPWLYRSSRWPSCFNATSAGWIGPAHYPKPDFAGPLWLADSCDGGGG